MSVLALSDLETLVLDLLQASAAVNPPVSTAQVDRFLNNAYADVKAKSGDRVVRFTGAGFSLSVDGSTFVTSAAGTMQKLLRVWRGTSVLDTTGAEMERVEPYRVYSQQQSFPTHGAPTMYAAERQGTTAPASVGLWRIYLWPICDGAYSFPSDVVREAQTLAVATDVPDLEEDEMRIMAHLAAARLAPLAGRAELVPMILQGMSDRWQDVLGLKAAAQLKPNNRPGKEAA